MEKQPVGSNILMPNITPGKYRKDYMLYQNKPCTTHEAYTCKTCLETRMKIIHNDIGYGAWSDSVHFLKREAEPRYHQCIDGYINAYA